jgi:hypothetical protein
MLNAFLRFPRTEQSQERIPLEIQNVLLGHLTSLAIAAR